MMIFRVLLMFGAGAILGALCAFGGAVLGFDVLRGKDYIQAFWYGVPVCVIGGGLLVFFLSRFLRSSLALRFAFITGYWMPVIWFVIKFVASWRAENF
jgi:hypothetical protein